MRLASSFCKLAGVMLAALFLCLAPARAQEKSAFVKLLEPFIDKREVAGVVTLAANEGKILELDAVGYANIEGMVLIKIDGVFWIASMSKPITAALLMMLVDEGKLKIDDPVEKYLPEFKGQKLAARARRSWCSPARPITIKDLLTHTSGITPHTALKPVPKLDMISLKDQCLLYAPGTADFRARHRVPLQQFRHQHCRPGGRGGRRHAV